MAVRIRLSRIGRKGVPFYRVVAVDGRKKRDGAFLDNIGTYDALGTKVVKFDLPLYEKWINQGAQPSDSVRKICKLYRRSQAPTSPLKGIPVKKAVQAPIETLGEGEMQAAAVLKPKAAASSKATSKKVAKK